MPGWFREVVELFRKVIHFFTDPLQRIEGSGFPLELLLAVAVVVIFVHLAVRMGRKAAASAEDDQGAPTVAARDEGWYWARADRFAMDGRFGPAMLAAFHAAMLHRTRLRAIPIRAGMTPREWLDRLELPAERRESLRQLVVRLYRTAFAAEPISAIDYQQWVRELRGATDARQA